jgi:hypothetical protein
MLQVLASGWQLESEQRDCCIFERCMVTQPINASRELGRRSDDSREVVLCTIHCSYLNEWKEGSHITPAPAKKKWGRLIRCVPLFLWCTFETSTAPREANFAPIDWKHMPTRHTRLTRNPSHIIHRSANKSFVLVLVLSVPSRWMNTLDSSTIIPLPEQILHCSTGH